MSYFASNKTRRVNLDDKTWVEIKEELSYGDTQKMAASFMKMKLKNNDFESDIDTETGSIELLSLAIVDWNLTDDAGEPVPVSKEAIRNLKASAAETIMTAYTEGNQSQKK